MRRVSLAVGLAVSLVVVACAIHADRPAERTAPVVTAGTGGCPTPPALQRQRFRHAGNRFYAGLGSPRHRGIDLIANEADPTQTLGGKLAYTKIDKDIGGEEVYVMACVGGAWKDLGMPMTDRHGRFELTLTGADRLPPGLRDLYAFVPGDGTGFRFLAYVARAGEKVIVTDVDGTVTASEGAVLDTVLFGEDIGHRAGAPQALAASGHTVVYLSSRGDQLTTLTRDWLRVHGFPVGPLRLARTGITRPGPRTVAFKADVLRDLPVPIAAAIGNRASDVEAYTRAGVPADRIFVKVPGFDSELAPFLAAGRATPFGSYVTLSPQLR